jgi:hypothetical protein
MNSIKLNFLPIITEDFIFPIYRKVIEGLVEKDSGYKVYRLFPNSESDERKNYYVSLAEQPDFERFDCHQKHNYDLTKWFLFHLLTEKVKNTEVPNKFDIYQKNKINELSFVVGEFDEGEQQILLSPYYLSKENIFGFIIDFKFRKKEQLPFNKEVQRLSLSLDAKYRSNRNFYLDKHKIIHSFLTKTFKNIRQIAYGEIKLEIDDSLIPLPSSNLDKKQYIFSKNRQSASQFLGMKNYGPLEALDREVEFVFIFEDKFKNFANDVFLSLIGKSNPGTFLGMDSMFNIQLDISKVRRVSIVDYEKETLLKAVEEVVSLNDTSKRTIAIFIEDYNEDHGDSEPYYFLKYHFLKKDIPLQVLNYQKLGARNTLKWSTSNIGLQIFSKLGGKPWIVKPSNADCLILGIGSSHKRDGSTGKIKKYFAYSICLDSSGLYKKLEVLSKKENEAEYLEELEKNLISLLKSSDFSSYKKCVLHLPFKIKRNEIEALGKVISEVSNMMFSVVKINVDNRFFGFSDHNTMVPYESSYIQLAGNQFLVWFEGLNYGKEIVDKRLANPVHIEFLKFGEQIMDYKPYLQDIINLSGANWRGFNAKSVPISIYYSKIITKYISEFGDIIDVENMSLTNDKPWFL